MANHELGAPPKAKAGRDATHIAIVPMIAAEGLTPGNHVGVMQVEGSPMTASTSFAPHIGIVDPFLKEYIKKGKRFYLCLYPGSVVGLTHVYTHPVLDGPSVESSAAWIEVWSKAQGIDMVDLMEHAEQWVDANKDKMTYDGFWSEGGRFEGQGLPEEFWDHYDRVMSTTVPKHARSNFFSCAC